MSAEGAGGLVGAVILAAGASSRMGKPKALLRRGARTFLEEIAATGRAAGVAEIVVVLGPPHGEAIRGAVPDGVRVAWNPTPGRGMLSSIQAGVASLSPLSVAALIWPIDQPFVAPDTVRVLLAAPEGRIAAPQHEGRGGHPVRIPRALFGELLALPVDGGLRALMRARRSLVERVEVLDAAVLLDVDTPADYLSRVGRRPGE